MTGARTEMHVKASAAAVFLAVMFFLLSSGLCRAQSFVDRAYDRGLKYALEGKFREAKEEFSRGLDIDPHFQPLIQSVKIVEDVIRRRISAQTAMHLFRSADYANQGLLDESIAEDEKALALAPGYAMAYNSLAASYIEKSEYDKAVSYLTRAIEIDPMFYETYVLRGLARTYQKQYEMAVSDYTRAIDINPKDPGIFYSRALANYLKGDVRNAARDARQAKAMGFPVPRQFLEDIRQSLNTQL